MVVATCPAQHYGAPPAYPCRAFGGGNGAVARVGWRLHHAADRLAAAVMQSALG